MHIISPIIKLKEIISESLFYLLGLGNTARPDQDADWGGDVLADLDGGLPSLYIYIYIYIQLHTCTYIYIYMYL